MLFDIVRDLNGEVLRLIKVRQLRCNRDGVAFSAPQRKWMVASRYWMIPTHPIDTQVYPINFLYRTGLQVTNSCVNLFVFGDYSLHVMRCSLLIDSEEWVTIAMIISHCWR